MVLATSEGKCSPANPDALTCPCPASVGASNIKRIPTTICKQLVKLRGKFQPHETKGHGSAHSNLLTAPDGYALVEFFGMSHLPHIP